MSSLSCLFVSLFFGGIPISMASRNHSGTEAGDCASDMLASIIRQSRAFKYLGG